MGGDRRTVLTGLACLAGTVACTSYAAPVLACASAGPGFRQITLERPDMPTIRYDAFRMGDDGLLQMATWTSDKRLLSVAADRLLEPALAQQFGEMVDDASGGSLFSRNAPSQPGPSAELGRLTSGRTKSSTTAITAELADLVDALSSGTPRTHLKGQAFLWTKPLPKTRPIDTDFTRSADCGSAVAESLALALTTGRLIVPVSGDTQAYFTGELANRMQFGARFDGGYMGYGILAS